MGGERGRAKFGDWFISTISLGFIPAHTKKTSVSLAPKDGIMAFFLAVEMILLDLVSIYPYWIQKAKNTFLKKTLTPI